MSDQLFEALKIVGKYGEKGVNLSTLRAEVIKETGGFDSKSLGDLCKEPPLCKLQGSSLVITEHGKAALAEGGIEISETVEEVPEEKKPKVKVETVKTRFVESFKEVSQVCWGIQNSKNILLTGPTGCGKSFLVEELAKGYKKKLWTVNCDVELDKTEIVGHHDIVTNAGNSETRWVKGIIQVAMENGDWVVLDEINMARPEVVSVLHQVLDHRRTLTIKEHDNEEVKAHPDFRIFGTMNPEYAGTAELNYAFRRRFEMIIPMSYLTPAKERKLIIDRTNISEDFADKCVKLANDTRKLKKDGKINFPLSTAHILEFATMLEANAFSPLECARVTLNVSDDIAENEDVMNCVKSYF